MAPRMTSTQEVCNALTMAAPSLVFVYCWISESEIYTFHTKLIVFTGWTHMYISLSYHMMCSLGYYDDRINCNLRKLDQSFIHMCGISNCVGLSGGDVLFSTTAVVVNAWFICKLWIPGQHDFALERRLNVVLSTILYLLPQLLRGDLLNLFGCVGGFFFAAVFFQLNWVFRGWGHSLSHLCYCPLYYAVLKSSVSAN